MVGVSVKAQPPKYDDLLVMFADGNYEKLVKSAEKYTLSDKTQNDPEPYMWLAKGLFAMSKDAKYTSDEVFKNAYKDGISAVGKFMRKDEDKSVYEENISFFSEYRRSLIEVIENELSTGNYSKAYGWAIKMDKFEANDPGNLLLKGACKYKKGDKSGATIDWKNAETIIDSTKSVENWTAEDMTSPQKGLLEKVILFLLL